MLTRYKTLEDGTVTRQADIYTSSEHGIDATLIDPDAIKIVRRLSSQGHEAYIVGGAVRDLLVGSIPKDFDIATDAAPGRIRKLFRNSRVIGKRFRLVHVYFSDDKIIEVSTFRSRDSEGFQNIYGDIEEDALRRDFSLNALYYSPVENTIIDYVGGFKDVQARKLKPVIPVDRIFTEDPVRMIRAVKYSVSTGFRIVRPLNRALVKSVHLLQGVSPSRMTEELFKILQSGRSRDVFEQAIRYDMLQYLLPGCGTYLAQKEFRRRLLYSAGRLDSRAAVETPGRDLCIAYLCGDYLLGYSGIDIERRVAFPDAFASVKAFLRPLVPANRDVEHAVAFLLKRKRRYLSEGVFD
ncbi:MAG: polynucleotide adenylyltransferase PcnB [Spirochaetota bacterium]